MPRVYPHVVARRALPYIYIFTRRNSTTPGHINTVASILLLQAVQKVIMASARGNLVLPPMIKTTVNKPSMILKDQRTDHQQKPRKPLLQSQSTSQQVGILQSSAWLEKAMQPICWLANSTKAKKKICPCRRYPQSVHDYGEEYENRGVVSIHTYIHLRQISTTTSLPPPPSSLSAPDLPNEFEPSDYSNEVNTLNRKYNRLERKIEWAQTDVKSLRKGSRRSWRSQEIIQSKALATKMKIELQPTWQECIYLAHYQGLGDEGRELRVCVTEWQNDRISRKRR